MMDNVAISYLVNILRYQNYISDLEKDVIDTWKITVRTSVLSQSSVL